MCEALVAAQAITLGPRAAKRSLQTWALKNFCLINFQFFLGMISNSAEFLFINQSLTRRITVAESLLYVSMFLGLACTSVVAAAFVFVS